MPGQYGPGQTLLENVDGSINLNIPYGQISVAAGVPAAPTGPAGGDLSGLYPNPTVDGLQTIPVSAVVPVPGDVLTLVGATWTPQAPAGGAPSGPAGGDLGLTYPNPSVLGFRGASFNPQLDNTTNIGSAALRPAEVSGVSLIARADATNTLRSTLTAAALLSTTVFGIDAVGDLTLGGAASTTAVLVGDAGTPTPLTVFGPVSLVDDLGVLGSVALGDAVTDQIVFNGRMNSDIDPIVDNAFSLGTSALRFLDMNSTTFVARADAIDSLKATLGGSSLVASSGFSVQANGVLGLLAAGTVAIERFGGMGANFGATDVTWFANGAPIRIDTLAIAGTTYAYDDDVASITESWTVDPAAAGGAWLRVGQQGAATFAGGVVAIQGGLGGAGGAGGEAQIRDSDGVPTVRVGGGTGGPSRFAVFNAVPIPQPTVTGSRGANAALLSVITEGVNLGLWIDGSAP